MGSLNRPKPSRFTASRNAAGYFRPFSPGAEIGIVKASFGGETRLARRVVDCAVVDSIGFPFLGLFGWRRLEQALELIAHLIAKGSQLVVTHRIGGELGLRPDCTYRQDQNEEPQSRTTEATLLVSWSAISQRNVA